MKMWRYLVGKSMSALLKLIDQRFTREDTFKGTIITVTAALNALNFHYIIKQCPREVSFLTHCFEHGIS